VSGTLNFIIHDSGAKVNDKYAKYAKSPEAAIPFYAVFLIDL